MLAHKRFLLLHAACSLLCLNAWAATFYVSTNGSDSNSGTQSAPFRTIQKAANVATAGSTVVVLPGSYSETVNLTASGSASAGKIKFQGFDVGGACPTTPVSDVNHPTGARPNSPVTLTGGFSINANYVSVACFRILARGGAFSIGLGWTNGDITDNEIDGSGTNGPGSGIGFSGVGSANVSQYASNFTILRNYIHGTSNGLWFICSNCTAQDNEIASLQGDEPGSDHDYIDIWGSNSAIRHNYMHDNTANACNSYDCHMDCIQTWNTTGNGTEVSKNIFFDRNICFNHHEGVIIQDNAGNGDVGGWTVTNNVFAYGPWDDGSGHLAVAGTAHPWCWIFEDGQLGAANAFYNNTCISGSMGFRNASGTASYKDNIWYGSNSTPYQNGGGTSVNGANNLYYSSPGSVGAVFAGDIVNQNPLFASLGSGSAQERCIGCNYSLQSASPAIDRGVNTGTIVSVDLKGTARPQGSAYDIGAYEFGSALPPPPPSGSPCDVNKDNTTNIVDVQQCVNQSLGVAACTADINKDGICNVVDVQRVVNAALGGQCVSP